MITLVCSWPATSCLTTLYFVFIKEIKYAKILFISNGSLMERLHFNKRSMVRISGTVFTFDFYK